MKQKSIVSVLFAGLALMLACQPKQQQVEQTEQKRPNIWIEDSGEVFTDSLLHQAELGIDSAQFKVSKCYLLGHGVDADDHKAFEWMKKSAEQGYYKAQTGMGIYYNTGVGVDSDKTQAIEWFKKAIEQGEPKAMHNLAIVYSDMGDYEQAKEWFMRTLKMDSENPATMSCMSALYFKQEKYDSAWYWANEAAKRDFSYAFYQIAGFYYYGHGTVEKNHEEAMKWTAKAAEKNLSIAQYNIGLAYDYGDGVPQDHEKALYWIRKAADNGLREAKDKLREMEKN